MRTITAANATELTAALDSAKGGETILLTGSDYGALTAHRRRPTSTVTIRSDDVGDRANFSQLLITESFNLKFDSISVQLPVSADTPNRADIIHIRASSNIQLSNSVVHGFDAISGVEQSATTLDASRNVIGLPVGTGVGVLRSNNIVISNNEISNVSRGIGFSDVKKFTITNNEIFDLRTSHITGGGLSDAVIAGNHLHSSKPWNHSGAGDHGDYIHIWMRGTTRAANSNVKITGNWIEEGDGVSLLGIYIDDNSSGIGFEKYEVSNNVLMIGDHQALRFENVHGSVFNNTLMQVSGAMNKRPQIVVVDNSNMDVYSNFASHFNVYNGAVVRQSNNIVVQGQTNDSTNYNRFMRYDPADGIDLQDVVLIPGTAAAAQRVGADLNLFKHWMDDAAAVPSAPPVGAALAETLTDMLNGSSKISTALWTAKPVPVEPEAAFAPDHSYANSFAAAPEYFGFA